MPSSHLVEVEVEVEFGVEVGVEVGVGGSGFGLLLAMFTTFTGGWVGVWCGEVENRANLS